jgi:hypothetical protein
MTSRHLMIVLAMGLLLCLAFVLLSQNASAAPRDEALGTADKNLAAKDGTQLGQKKFDRDRLPGKLEMGLAIGSFIAMVAVVKWL